MMKYTKSNEKINYEAEIRDMSHDEYMPKGIEKGFYGFDLPREKLFTYPWETAEMKENHPDQKIENI